MAVTIPWVVIERIRSTERRTTRRKIFSISTLSITHPTRTALGLNTGHREENLLTDLVAISRPLVENIIFMVVKQADSPEKLVTIYQTTQCHTLENLNLNINSDLRA
jgi:hypothetical protein